MKKPLSFEEFLCFWNNEVEKKLRRCSKEFGFYPKLWTTLFNKDKKIPVLIGFYKHVKNRFTYRTNPKNIIDLSNAGVKRKFSVLTPLKDSRHFSQLVIFKIFESLCLDDETFKKAFKMMDNEIYKNHKFETFYIEKIGLIKAFF